MEVLGVSDFLSIPFGIWPLSLNPVVLTEASYRISIPMTSLPGFMKKRVNVCVSFLIS